MTNNQSNPGWGNNYTPSAEEWAAAFADKQDANAPQVLSDPITLGSSGDYIFNGIAPATWTLPPLASKNSPYFIKNAGTADLTLQTQQAENLYFTTLTPSLTMHPGDSYYIANVGAFWVVEGPIISSIAYSRIIALTTDYTVSELDVAGGILILDVNASGGAVVVTVPPSLAVNNTTPIVIVTKVDGTFNPISISDGVTVVDVIVTPGTPDGQAGGSRVVYTNGTNLRADYTACYTPVPDIATMQGFSQVSPLIAHVYVNGVLGGAYDWNPTSTDNEVAGKIYTATFVSTGRWIKNTTAIVNYSSSLTPAAVDPNTTQEQTFTVTGLLTTDLILLTPPGGTDGLLLGPSRCSAPDTLATRWANVTGGSLTPAAGTYGITVFRF